MPVAYRPHSLETTPAIAISPNNRIASTSLSERHATSLPHPSQSRLEWTSSCSLNRLCRFTCRTKESKTPWLFVTVFHRTSKIGNRINRHAFNAATTGYFAYRGHLMVPELSFGLHYCMSTPPPSALSLNKRLSYCGIGHHRPN